MTATDFVECSEEVWMTIKQISDPRKIHLAELRHTFHKLCRHLQHGNDQRYESTVFTTRRQRNLAKTTNCKCIHQAAAQVQSCGKAIGVQSFTRGHSNVHSFIHSYSFNVEVDITQLQTDREARKEDRIIKRLTLR